MNFRLLLSRRDEQSLEPTMVCGVLDNYANLVDGFKHGFYFPFHIWDVIPTPLTNSIFFPDGYCTSNQNMIYPLYTHYIPIEKI